MCEGKKTYLRLYSGDRNSGTDQNPKFLLNRPIENIKSFQIKQFMIDIENITSKFMIINSPELSSLTEDLLQGSYNGVSQSIMSVDTGANVINLINTFENPTFQCSKSRLNSITFDFKREDGINVCAGFTNQKWSMLIVFNH
tara:strand:+ start:1600 stop:2025 length:426 start_codon:yes stop_codon:yes gene_type:complete